jgi:hypothetical protein
MTGGALLTELSYCLSWGFRSLNGYFPPSASGHSESYVISCYSNSGEANPTCRESSSCKYSVSSQLGRF